MGFSYFKSFKLFWGWWRKSLNKIKRNFNLRYGIGWWGKKLKKEKRKKFRLI